MARKKFLYSQNLSYHVRARCINKEWFKLPMDRVWDIFEKNLYFSHHAFGLEIQSFVLMNNHFHGIVKTPKESLDIIMNYFMRETSRQLAYDSGRINQIFGGPYRWSLLTTQLYFSHAYKYIYRNPVEANIVKAVEDYSYSTLQGLLGKQKLIIPVTSDNLLFGNTESVLSWLNTPYEKSNYEAIRMALKKSEFKFGRTKDSKPSILEEILV